MALGRALFCSVALFWIASAANAIPQTFSFVSGQVHITANVVGQAGFLLDTVQPLDGSFIDFESAPVGVTDFEISIAPTGSLMLSSSYGGYDTIVIESSILTPGVGYTSSGSFLGGGQYSVLMGPVDVDAVYSASDSGMVTPPVANVPLSFTNPSLTATVNADLVTFEMNGVTLGIIPGALVGETSDLIVKGDITFVGIVPEPGTGLLMGLGLSGIGLLRRRASRESIRHD